MDNLTISPIVILEQPIIVTPDGAPSLSDASNGPNLDQTSFFARPVPVQEASLRNSLASSSSSTTTSTVDGDWEYHSVLGKK